ncbi:MAG: TolB family protein [Salinivirgaceae bacterium]
MKTKLYLIVSVLIALNACQQRNPEQLSGDYFGQEFPGSEPVLFAPGYVSSGIYTRDVSIAPDGKSVYFSASSRGFNFIMFTEQINGVWTEPEIASFCGNGAWYDYEPLVTPDGNRILFLSTRPPAGKDPKPGWFYEDIWAVDKTDQGWSEPKPLDSSINTANGEFFPSLTQNGTLYFTRSYADSNRIFRSEKMADAYAIPEMVSIESSEHLKYYNAFISPDESYMIACVSGLDSTNNPLYAVAYAKEKGKFHPFELLPERINRPGQRATAASVSSDGKFLFFASSAPKNPELNIKPGISQTQLFDMLQKPQNGMSNVYWVSTKGLIKEQ